MKGLLLKDFYMATKYCKSYLFVLVAFLAASCCGKTSMFFCYYPCMIFGLIPVNMLSYDERSKWNVYSAALPYSKAQIVSGKYIIGIAAQLAVIIITAATQAVKMQITDTFVLSEFMIFTSLLLMMSCFSAALTLPFMFKYGVEKGRIAYFIIIGIICASAVMANSAFEKLKITLSSNGILWILCVAGIAAYALSWYLSIVFYKKQEF